tara:strand:+ start:157 stop:501 length:345 start_codon:yes stop_codon:yes gene_type:complete
MASIRGRNTNSNSEATVTTYEVNPGTATTVAAANPDRMYLSVALDVGTTARHAYVRLYPAGTDNIKKGDPLAVETDGNDNIFTLVWRMTPDNVYTGEVSVITTVGTFDVHVTEY